MFARLTTTPKKPNYRLAPDFIAESVDAIDFTYLRNQGITTCFIDLDGTVVDRGAFEVAHSLSAALRASGLAIHITTNRPRSRDLQNLKDDLHADRVIHPQGIFGKPTKHYFVYALREAGISPSEGVMIGDRFIQDIWGANRAGIYSLLVYKLGESKGRLDEALSRAEKNYALRLTGSYTDLTAK